MTHRASYESTLRRSRRWGHVWTFAFYGVGGMLLVMSGYTIYLAVRLAFRLTGLI